MKTGSDQLVEMPYIMPEEPVRLPGTDEVIDRVLDLRLERDRRTRGKQAFYRWQLMTNGLVWRTEDGDWVFVKGGMGSDEQIVKRATPFEVETTVKLPNRWEKVARVDTTAEPVREPGERIRVRKKRPKKRGLLRRAFGEQSPLFGIDMTEQFGEYAWDEIEDVLTQYGLDTGKVFGVLKRSIHPAPFDPEEDFTELEIRSAVVHAGYTPGDAMDVARRLSATRTSVLTGVAEATVDDVSDALEPVLDRANRRVVSLRPSDGGFTALLDNGVSLEISPSAGQGALGEWIISVEGEQFDPMSPKGVEELVRRVESPPVGEDTYTSDIAITDVIPITKGGRKVVRLPGLKMAKRRKMKRRYQRVGESMSRGAPVVSLVLRPREVGVLDDKPVWSALHESGVIEVKPFKMGAEEFVEVRIDTQRKEWGEANVTALLDEVGAVSPGLQSKIQERADPSEVAGDINNWVQTAVFDYAEAEWSAPSPKTEKIIREVKLRGTMPTKEWLAERLFEDPEVVHEIIMLRDPGDEVMRELTKAPTDVVSKAAKLHFGGGMAEQETTDPAANLSMMGIPQGSTVMTTMEQDPEAGTVSSSTWRPGGMFKLHVLSPTTGKGEWVFREVVGHEGEGEKSTLVYKTPEGRVMRLTHEQIDNALGFGGAEGPEALGVKMGTEPGEEEPVPPMGESSLAEAGLRTLLRNVSIESDKPGGFRSEGGLVFSSLQRLVKMGLVKRVSNRYYITPEGKERLKGTPGPASLMGEQEQETPEVRGLERDPNFARALAKYHRTKDDVDWQEVRKEAQRVLGVAGPEVDKVVGQYAVKEDVIVRPVSEAQAVPGSRVIVTVYPAEGESVEEIDAVLSKEFNTRAAANFVEVDPAEADEVRAQRAVEKALQAGGISLEKAGRRFEVGGGAGVATTEAKDGFKGRKKTVAGREVEEPTHLKSLAKKAGVSLDKALTAWGEAQRDFAKAHPDVKKGSDRFYKGVTGYVKSRLQLPTKPVKKEGTAMEPVKKESITEQMDAEYFQGEEHDPSELIDTGDRIEAGPYGKLWVTKTGVVGDLWVSSDRSDVETGRGRGLRYSSVKAVQKGGEGPWYGVKYDFEDDFYTITDVRPGEAAEPERRMPGPYSESIEKFTQDPEFNSLLNKFELTKNEGYLIQATDRAARVAGIPMKEARGLVEELLEIVKESLEVSK